MFQIDGKSTHREIVLFIHSLPRYEVAALSVFLNNNFDAEIPSYATKYEMIEHIKELEKQDLLEALEFLYPDECDEDAENIEDAEDDDSADDQESEDDEE